MACRLEGAKPLSKPMLEYCYWTLRNKLKGNYNHNSNIFIQDKSLENLACETTSVLSWPQYVNRFSVLTNELISQHDIRSTFSIPVLRGILCFLTQPVMNKSISKELDITFNMPTSQLSAHIMCVIDFWRYQQNVNGAIQNWIHGNNPIAIIHVLIYHHSWVHFVLEEIT